MFAGAGPLLLVGAGNMGGAMLKGWLDKGLDPAQLTVLDPNIDESLRTELRDDGGSCAALAEEISDRDFRTLVLAVKPQVMEFVLSAVAPLANAETTVVSVAAGIRLTALEAAFPPGQPVIRAMPNTPAQIGMGMTVAVANAHVAEEQRKAVDVLLGAIGKVAWVEDESLIDAVTAVSGSGPAYVFLLAESLAEAGRQAGLPFELALTLARQTIAGAGLLLSSSPLPPDQLRRNVTSPNGTTAAALSVLMADDGLQPLLTRAVAAAKARSVELG